MGGLKKICKYYGRMEVTNPQGQTVIWLWDYVADKPRLKSEMSKEEIKASNKAKLNPQSSKEGGWDSWYKQNVNN